MTEYIQCQDMFSKGELAPSMYARVTTSIYPKGLKTAQNILPIPQGGARKRFGTILRKKLAQTNYAQIYPMVFEYYNECIYNLIFYSGSIDIYLEGVLVATVSSTGIDQYDVSLIDHSVLEGAVRITTGFMAPKDLTRAAGSANTITAVDTSTYYITLNTAITNGIIIPVQFTTSGAFPTSIPQIKAGRTYFIRALSTTTAAVFSTATDAAANINRFSFSAAGTSNSMVPLNTWTFATVTFRNVPVYDFQGTNYDGYTFTPGATTGATTLTSDTNVFSAAYVGGLFSGNGGIGRLTVFTDAKHMNMTVIEDFASTAGILGSVALLAEPAWSDARGWPTVTSSYQNRAVMANSESLPNGIWLSITNDYQDFDDSTLDDDMAISWYPSSSIGTFIKYITPFRSLLVHTDAGIFSTPTQTEYVATPRTFFLTLQDNTPSATIEPVICDNQIMVVSGRDVSAYLWDFAQSADANSNVSLISEHLITDPISMDDYSDLTQNGGRYLFIINSDGTMAMYQTVMSQDIAGWTWAKSEQSYGKAYFRYVMSSTLGRCWFIMQRDIATAQSAIAISAYSAVNKTLTATASNFSTTVPTAVLFATTGTLPATTPQITTTQYYWVIGVTANTFITYMSQSDALAAVNPIVPSSDGTSSTVIPYTLVTALNLEELSYDVNTDCAILQSGTNLTSATGLAVFDGQVITVKADGYVFDSNPVISGSEAITIMGVSTEVDSIEVGYPINYVFEPLPISVAMGANPNTSNLAQAKHIRAVNVMCVNSVGGQVNGQNIALTTLDEVTFGAPQGELGIMAVSLMKGWNQFKSPAITITHSDPYDFNVIGLFYKLEV